MNDARPKRYLFSYPHAGARWNFEIWADSPEDARARVSKLAYAAYDGELVAKLPTSTGLVVKALISVRNALRGMGA